jgi:hypothetical protein
VLSPRFPRRDARRIAVRLEPPESVRTLQRKLYRKAKSEDPSDACSAVKVTGEPDAGEPHVRFDEGVLGLGHGRASEAPPDERGVNR